MKTIKFHTLGCKVNQYDTQMIREQFLNSGFKELGNGSAADVYLINTCTVTGRADSQSFNLIRRAARENPKARIIVTGCLAELDADKIKGIDKRIIIFKNKDKDKIQKPAENKGISYFEGHTRAFLKIQDGCDNFCSYCKVPLVRGRPRSKPVREILREAEGLARNGFKEIVLCGICLGAYGKGLKPKVDLVDVIEGLEGISGILRIRLSSIEAGDVSDKLLAKMVGSEKLCPSLHIPLQSGDDGILRKMNRKYNRADFLKLIRKVQSKVKGVAVTTDVLVGFPGESEEQFQNTVKALKAIKPLKAHIFPYSPREGTLAAKNYRQQLDPELVRKRAEALRKLSDAYAQEFSKRFAGKKMKVLWEGESKEKPGYLEGYTDNYIRVFIKKCKKLENSVMTICVGQV